MKENKISPEVHNKNYFVSLALTRASVGMLAMQSFALLILSFLGLIVGILVDEWYNNLFSSVFNVILKFFVIYAVLINLIIFLLPQRFMFKHQVINSILLFLTVFFETIIIVGMSFIVINSKSAGNRRNVSNFDPYLSQFFLVTISIVAIISVIYNIYWLKTKLKHGFSEQRVIANYFSVSNKFNSNTVWFIFGAVSISGMILTSYKFVLGFGSALLLVMTFTRLLVEIAYLTYLKSKDKTYWETYVEQPRIPFKKRFISILKKKVTYIIFSMAILYGMVKIDEIYSVSRSTKNYFAIVIVMIFISYVILFIQWLINKQRNKDSRGKKR